MSDKLTISLWGASINANGSVAIYAAVVVVVIIALLVYLRRV